MVSNTTQIKDVTNQQKQMYYNHAGPNQSCYISATKMKPVLEFNCWAVFDVKDPGAEHDTASATVFDCDCMDSIMYE